MQPHGRAFSRFLVPCDVPKTYWAHGGSPWQTIQRVGGVCSTGPPNQYHPRSQLSSVLISELKGLGLDGIEKSTPWRQKQEDHVFTGLGHRLQLIPTGGFLISMVSRSHEQIGKGRGGIHFFRCPAPALTQIVLLNDQLKLADQHFSLYYHVV